MQRQSSDFAGEVPEGDVHVTLNGGIKHPAARSEAVPHRSDVEWVAPNEHLRGGSHELLEDVRPGPADEGVPGQTLVGPDCQDAKRPRRNARQCRLRPVKQQAHVTYLQEVTRDPAAAMLIREPIRT